MASWNPSFIQIYFHIYWLIFPISFMICGKAYRGPWNLLVLILSPPTFLFSFFNWPFLQSISDINHPLTRPNHCRRLSCIAHRILPCFRVAVKWNLNAVDRHLSIFVVEWNEAAHTLKDIWSLVSHRSMARFAHWWTGRHSCLVRPWKASILTSSHWSARTLSGSLLT